MLADPQTPCFKAKNKRFSAATGSGAWRCNPGRCWSHKATPYLRAGSTISGRAAAGQMGAERGVYAGGGEWRLAEIPGHLERLRKSGQAELWQHGGEAPFLRERGRFALGYAAEIAVSDAGCYSNQNVRDLQERGIDVYLPDPHLVGELRTGRRARTIVRQRGRSPELKAMRRRLRSWAWQWVYELRNALVEPVIRVLKQQRSLRQFRTREQIQVATEFTPAAVACNLTVCSAAGWHPNRQPGESDGSAAHPTEATE